MKKIVISVAILTTSALFGVSGSYAAQAQTKAAAVPPYPFQQIIQTANLLVNPNVGSSATATPVKIDYKVGDSVVWTANSVIYQNFDNFGTCDPKFSCGVHRWVDNLLITPLSKDTKNPTLLAPYKAAPVSISTSKITSTQIILIQDPDQPAPTFDPDTGAVKTQGTIKVIKQEQ